VSCSIDPNSITTVKSSAVLQHWSHSPRWLRLFWRQLPLTFCANSLEPHASILMSLLTPKADIHGGTRSLGVRSFDSDMVRLSPMTLTGTTYWRPELILIR
jgi:hypothetical protein